MGKIETNTAVVELMSEGFVRATIHPQARQGLTEAMENLAATVTACQGQRRPLLVDIRNCQPLEPEARRYYSGDVFKKSFLALAMLVDMSPVGMTAVNVYLRIAKIVIPVQMFTDEAKAVEWLKGFVK